MDAQGYRETTPGNNDRQASISKIDMNVAHSDCA